MNAGEPTTLLTQQPLRRNPRRGLTDRRGMGSAEWFDLGEGYGVLELPKGAAGAALELHVVVHAETDRTIAWWENESGTCLTVVDAGVA
jgi:hypothetical protein